MCPIAATLTTLGNSILAANGKGVAIDYTVLAQPRRPDFGLDRLKIGAQGPIRSGDAEGLASVMEVFV